jgi:hypothetical protein
MHVIPLKPGRTIKIGFPKEREPADTQEKPDALERAERWQQGRLFRGKVQRLRSEVRNGHLRIQKKSKTDLCIASSGTPHGNLLGSRKAVAANIPPRNDSKTRSNMQGNPRSHLARALRDRHLGWAVLEGVGYEKLWAGRWAKIRQVSNARNPGSEKTRTKHVTQAPDLGREAVDRSATSRQTSR